MEMRRKSALSGERVEGGQKRISLLSGFLKCFSESVSATSKEFLLQRGGQLNVILDLGAAVSQLEQARVDQTAVVPGSYGPSPCPDVAALVHFGIAAFFFVAGSREPEFPRTLPYYLVDNCAWL